MELLGLTPGQPAPPPILQPPPDYPPLDRKPLELRVSNVDEYLLTVKQELRQQMRQSHFYVKAGLEKREVERYSDRYQSVKVSEMDDRLGWEVNWNYFPKELKLLKAKKRRSSSSKYSPTVAKKKRTSRKRTSTEKQDVDDDTSVPSAKRKKQVSFANGSSEEVTLDTTSRLSELEKLESKTAVEGVTAEEDEEDIVSEEEVYDEEIEEEGTDYNLTYFDNGEDYLGGEEDALEENEGPYY